MMQWHKKSKKHELEDDGNTNLGAIMMHGVIDFYYF